METLPFRLIDEPIEVEFSEPPLYEKKPPCPIAFTWRGVKYAIAEVLEEWEDYRRRGKMERNMVPGHISQALRKGSWGVGRFYFRIRVEEIPGPPAGRSTGTENDASLKEDRVYEIYFDRAPASAGDRKGHWFILGERRSANLQE
jgi:hypothetical protein